MDHGTTDRRAHPRHARSFTIEGGPADETTLARMRARNLSLGGLYCTSPNDYPEMTRLSVRLQLPFSDETGSEARVRSVDVEAVVVRRSSLPSPTGGDHRFELGLFFTRVEPEVRETIERFLAATVDHPVLDG